MKSGFHAVEIEESKERLLKFVENEETFRCERENESYEKSKHVISLSKNANNTPNFETPNNLIQLKPSLKYLTNT